MPYITNCTNRIKDSLNFHLNAAQRSLGVLFPRLVLLSFAVFIAPIYATAQQSTLVEPAKTSISMLDSTRDQDGLFGPVRRVHTEMSKLNSTSGKVVEEPRLLLEVTTYDPQGKRIWNVYYPVNTGAFRGNQEFAYDEQGHVKEMTLRDDTGRVLSREAYAYEYDSFGNWTRMTSSLVIFEDGKIVNEPFEVTIRTFSYYYDDSVAKIVKSPTSTIALTTTQPTGNAKSTPAPAAITAPAGETGEAPKSLVSDKTAQTEPLVDKTIRPGNDTANTNQHDDKQTANDAEVSSVSPVQAYQIPQTTKGAPGVAKPNVSGGVVNGKIIRLPKPVYPAGALSRGLVGKVVVEVTLDEQGQVVSARGLSGHPLLLPSAVSAAKMARFEPTLLSGQPVKATRLINFDFNSH